MTPGLALRLPDRLRPRVVVWEITRACNGRCVHCGSLAGRPRAQELSTREALDVIDELAALGCQTVTFSGGEPLLRPDWAELGRRVRAQGLRLELMSNGLLIEAQLAEILAADLASVSLSVDGPARAHDRLRGAAGHLEQVLGAARALAARGMRVGAVTQVGRANMGMLAETHDLIRENGFRGWLIQLTLPYGRAADCSDELVLAPSELPQLEAELLAVIDGSPLRIQIADTIGYFSVNEPRLRSGGARLEGFWGGCQAGLQALGLTSDGTVRGCLSMPPELDEGNVRDRPLTEIWLDEKAFSYNRCFSTDRLQGACADCAFAPMCRGGCTALAQVSTGSVYRNSYCLRTCGS